MIKISNETAEGVFLGLGVLFGFLFLVGLFESFLFFKDNPQDLHMSDLVIRSIAIPFITTLSPFIFVFMLRGLLYEKPD